MEDKFWIVWSPDGSTPTNIRHATFASAMTMAMEFANRFKNEEFFVLGCERSVIGNNICIKSYAVRDARPKPGSFRVMRDKDEILLYHPRTS